MIEPKSLDVFRKVIAGEVVTIAQTYLVDGIVDVLDVEFTHSPDLLKLAVDHHCVWIANYACLLSEGCLLSLLRNQKRNRLFDMLKSKSLDPGESV